MTSTENVELQKTLADLVLIMLAASQAETQGESYKYQRQAHETLLRASWKDLGHIQTVISQLANLASHTARLRIHQGDIPL